MIPIRRQVWLHSNSDIPKDGPENAHLTVYFNHMCGRFAQHLSWEQIHRLVGLIGATRNLAPRCNISPFNARAETLATEKPMWRFVLANAYQCFSAYACNVGPRSSGRWRPQDEERSHLAGEG